MASWSAKEIIEMEERRAKRDRLVELAAYAFVWLFIISALAIVVFAVFATVANAGMMKPIRVGLEGAPAVSHAFQGGHLGLCSADLVHFGVPVDGKGPAELGYDSVTEKRTVNGEDVDYSFDPAPSRNHQRFFKLAAGYVLDLDEMTIYGPCYVTPLPRVYPDPDLIERWLSRQ